MANAIGPPGLSNLQRFFTQETPQAGAANSQQQSQFRYGAHTTPTVQDGAGRAFTHAGVPPVSVSASLQTTSFQTTPHSAALYGSGYAFTNPGVAPVSVSLSFQTTQFQRSPHNASLIREYGGYSWIVSPPPTGAATPAVITAVLTKQEQPYHPGPIRWHGIQGPNVAPPIPAAITKQEQPSHPLPTKWHGVQGPNVATGITNYTVTAQQQPGHPASFSWSLPPRSVAAVQQVAEFRYGTHTSPNVQDGAGRALTQTGVQGPNVVSAETRFVITKQEQPGHPTSIRWHGVQGPNVAPPITISALTKQEAPPTFTPLTIPGVQGPNVALGVTNYAVTVQQQPDHPRSWLVSSYNFAQNLVLTPERRWVVTTQEQPSHPLPASQAGVQGPNVGTGITNKAITAQQQPDHPLPWLRSSYNFQPSLALLPERRSAITTQEQPGHPLPIKWHGVQGPNVATGITSVAITLQAQPGHPAPFAWSFPPIAAASIQPLGNQIRTVQEQPWHPTPYVAASFNRQDAEQQTAQFRYGIHTEALIKDGVGRVWTQSGIPSLALSAQALDLVRSPNPDQLGAYQWIQSGVPPTSPIAQAPGIAALITKAEAVLGHPLPFIWSTIVVSRGVVPPITNQVQTRQEFPSGPGAHPGTFTFGPLGFVASVFAPPITNRVIVTQEDIASAYHPGIIAFAGPPGPNVTPPKSKTWIYRGGRASRTIRR